jgi:hypothetical protein
MEGSHKRVLLVTHMAWILAVALVIAVVVLTFHFFRGRSRA